MFPGGPLMNSSDLPTLLSLNRFERKKNAALAMKSFAAIRPKIATQPGYKNMRLILAGNPILSISSCTNLCLDRWLRSTFRRQHAGPLLPHRPCQIPLPNIQRHYSCFHSEAREDPASQHDTREPGCSFPSKLYHFPTHSHAPKSVYDSLTLHPRE